MPGEVQQAVAFEGRAVPQDQQRAEQAEGQEDQAAEGRASDRAPTAAPEEEPNRRGRRRGGPRVEDAEREEETTEEPPSQPRSLPSPGGSPERHQRPQDGGAVMPGWGDEAILEQEGGHRHRQEEEHAPGAVPEPAEQERTEEPDQDAVADR